MGVLIAIDDSDPARKALEHGFSVHPGEDITVLHVLNPPESATYGEARMYVDWEEVMEDRRERAEELLDAARDRADDHDAPVVTEVVVGRPARAIVEYAEEHDVDHVVIGSHGRSGVSRVLLGSVAESVVRRSPCPVTVVR
ncbi:universal stress protein [Natronorarus salvus]|uniref:universal stress protein n=1 Tax=Natronorarus salvus TaxID=3117733 RepID=UPI002F26C895